MAIIKMDMSEYEAMKRADKLLKEALSRELKALTTIDKLNADKISALKENSKRVTIVRRNTTLETKSVVVGIHDFKHQIDYLHGLLSQRNTSWGSIEELTFARSSFERLFQTHTHETEGEDSITYVGLSEYLKTMREDYDSKRSAADKTKLSNADESLAINRNLITENKKFKRMAEVFSKKADDLVKEAKEAKKEQEEFIKALDKVANKSSNIFNYATYQVEVIKLANSLKEKNNVK